MGELGLVALLVGGLVTMPLFVRLVPWTLALSVGSVLVAVGLAVGLPAGAVYHVALWRAARPAPRRWWLRPTSLHERLEGRPRKRVLAWFRLGAVGFVMALFGCMLVAVGAWGGR